MEKIEVCQLCSSRELKPFYKGIDKYFSNQEVSFVSCHNCSLVALSPRPTAEEFAKLYDSVFQDQRREIETFEQAVERVKEKGYAHKEREAEFFRGSIKEGGSYLDIGGAWGTLAKAAKEKYKIDATLVEPSARAGEVAAKYHGHTVFHGMLEDFIESAESDGKTFDFIALSHVFEHALDLNEFLSHLKQLLAKDGKVYIAVPDIKRPFELSERFFHMEHTFYFSLRTLKQILEKNGFKIEKVSTKDFDIKLIASLNGSQGTIEPFSAADLPEIKSRIARVDRKYKVLRGAKKAVHTLLPGSARRKTSALAAKTLRKLKIIKA